jgi:tetratricopeptide (TPR) repeat protein
MAVQALVTLTGRVEANGAELDLESASTSGRASAESALQGYQAAENSDPLNPEYPLKAAAILESLGQEDAAAAEARRAIDCAPIGKTYYRYGRLLARQGKTSEATAAFENARRVEPNNLDNLLALADSYATANRAAEAEAVWRVMVQLSRSDFGRIRAVPELIEWQYGRAFQQLGQAKMVRGENERAAADLREAVGILGTFWKQRDLLIAQIRVRPDDRRRTADYYRESLEAYEKVEANLGRHDEAAKAKQERVTFESERLKEESAKAG